MKRSTTVAVGVYKGAKMFVYVFPSLKEGKRLSKWASDHGCFAFCDPKSDLPVDTLEWWVAAMNHGAPIRDLIR